MNHQKLIRNTIILLFLIALMWAIYTRYINKELFQSDSQPEVKIVLFWAKWCHYCEEYLEQNTFMDTYNQMSDKNKVLFVQYEYDQNKAFANRYEVSSFPTIISIDKNGNLIDKFGGDRTNPADLVNFTQASLGKVN